MKTKKQLSMALFVLYWAEEQSRKYARLGIRLSVTDGDSEDEMRIVLVINGSYRYVRELCLRRDIDDLTLDLVMIQNTLRNYQVFWPELQGKGARLVAVPKGCLPLCEICGELVSLWDADALELCRKR